METKKEANLKINYALTTNTYQIKVYKQYPVSPPATMENVEHISSD